MRKHATLREDDLVPGLITVFDGDQAWRVARWRTRSVWHFRKRRPFLLVAADDHMTLWTPLTTSPDETSILITHNDYSDHHSGRLTSVSNPRSMIALSPRCASRLNLLPRDLRRRIKTSVLAHVLAASAQNELEWYYVRGSIDHHPMTALGVTADVLLRVTLT